MFSVPQNEEEQRPCHGKPTVFDFRKPGTVRSHNFTTSVYLSSGEFTSKRKEWQPGVILLILGFIRNLQQNCSRLSESTNENEVKTKAIRSFSRILLDKSLVVANSALIPLEKIYRSVLVRKKGFD